MTDTEKRSTFSDWRRDIAAGGAAITKAAVAPASQDFRPPDDCPWGELNPGATEAQNWVIDCNICTHEQPCGVPVMSAAGVGEEWAVMVETIEGGGSE